MHSIRKFISKVFVNDKFPKILPSKNFPLYGNNFTASDDSVDSQLGLDIPSISDLKEDNTNKLLWHLHVVFCLKE